VTDSDVSREDAKARTEVSDVEPLGLQAQRHIAAEDV
jgi:hypothetical protein